MCKQLVIFKIPAEPDQILNYKTLLFPTNYLRGKVVDADVRTIPIPNASISLILITERSATADILQIRTTGQSSGTFSTQDTMALTTNSLGAFEAGNLQQGEYRITIQKEGYATREDFVRISGLLQEQEFTLQKE